MTLIVNDVPPSLNLVLRMHWTNKKKANDYWLLLIRSAIGNVENLPKTREEMLIKKRVKITLWHSRMYDRDNAYGAVKPLVDALGHWHLIWNDTERYMDLTVEQEKCKHKERHTVIELEPA